MTPLLLELDAAPGAPGAARRAVRRALAGVAPQVADDVLLVVSELVTNAVRHGDGRLCLEVVVRRGHVEVAVADGSAADPRVLPPSATGEGGRGMALVEAVATAWGVEPRAGGKRVWARFAAA